MKNHTEKTDKKRLEEAVDTLMEENQRYFLGVLDTLAFAQTGQDKGEKEKESPVCLS